MEEILLTVGSITQAQRARQILICHRISATLTRIPNSNCRYGLRMDARSLDAAYGTLAAAGLKVET